MSEWKGADALNSSETAEAFWDVVGQPAKVEDAVVGQAVNMEHGSRRWVAIIREKWVDGDGNIKIRFSDPKPGEKYAPPILTILGRTR